MTLRRRYPNVEQELFTQIWRRELHPEDILKLAPGAEDYDPLEETKLAQLMAVMLIYKGILLTSLPEHTRLILDSAVDAHIRRIYQLSTIYPFSSIRVWYFAKFAMIQNYGADDPEAWAPDQYLETRILHRFP